MAYLRDRRAFGNIGTRKFRGARFGDPLSPRGPQYTLEGRVLDYSTDVGPFTIVDKSGEGNTATLYSGRGLTMDAVGDNVTYATGYSLAERTATLLGRFNVVSPVVLGGQSGFFTFYPTATGVWEELTATATVSGDLDWELGSDFDIGDLRVDTEHWTHNDWSDPTANGLNGKTIVDSGPNGYHGVCTGCSGFTGEGIDPEVAGIVGLDDARWFNGVDAEVILSTGITLTGDFDISLTFIGVDQSSGGHFFADTAVAAVARGFFTASDIRLITSTDPALTATVTFDRGAHTVRFRRSSGTAYIDFDGVNLTSAASTGSLVITGIGSVRGAGSTSTPTFNGVMLGVDFGTAAYTGRGATPWVDTIGTNDGTESGTFVSVGQKRATIPQTADRNWNKSDVPFTADITRKCDGGDALTGGRTATVDTGDYVEGTGSLEFTGSGISAAFSHNLCFTSFFNSSFSDGDVWEIKLWAKRVSGTGNLSFRQYAETTAGTFANHTPTGTDWEFVTARITINTPANTNGTYRSLCFSAEVGAVWKIDYIQAFSVGDFRMIPASDANDQIDAFGAPILEPRLNNQQLNLFGDGEYSSTPDSDSLDLTTAATWEVWGNFYGAAPAPTQAILSKTRFSTDDRTVDITKSSASADNTVNFTATSNGFGETIFSKTLTVTDKLSHIVFTYDGATQTMVGYIDGVPTAFSATSGTVTTSLFENTQPYMIGARPSVDPAANYAPFKIGSAKIYNVALTAAEVLTNYNTQKSLYGL